MTAVTLNRFDYFLYSTALLNHGNCLAANWEGKLAGEEDAPLKYYVRCTLAYITGMIEHAVLILTKVSTLTLFIFVNIAISFYFASAWIQNLDEVELTRREIRVYVGWLIMGEALYGTLVDTLGLLCPPLAYKIHDFAKSYITAPYFRRWGIVMPNDLQQFTFLFYANLFIEGKTVGD